MTKHDGQISGLDKPENYLMSPIDKEETP